MARDIEEFLKRAAERRRQQQAPGKVPPQRQSPPPQRQAPPQQRQSPPPRPIQKPMIIDDIEVMDDPYAGETVAEHVQAHIRTDDVTEHASHLGEEVAARDDRVEERIHKKFDHDVGNLESKPSAQDTTTAVTEQRINEDASALFTMLLNPKTVAQSILISEILKRPDF